MNILKFLAIFFFDIIDKYIHQKKILKNLKKNLKHLNIFIDVGSHKGTYTDLIVNNFKTKKIYMFEPQRKIFQFIKKKYKNSKKIEIFNQTISNLNQMQKIYVNKHDLTTSLTKLNKENFYLKCKAILFGVNTSGMINETYNVRTIKLDDIIKVKKLKNIDLIKIDTEGHEYKVLQSLKKNIKKVKIILIEFHNDNIFLNYNSNKIHKFLIKNNFFLQEKIKFPFTTWEDRVYINKN